MDWKKGIYYSVHASTFQYKPVLIHDVICSMNIFCSLEKLSVRISLDSTLMAHPISLMYKESGLEGALVGNKSLKVLTEQTKSRDIFSILLKIRTVPLLCSSQNFLAASM